ncbi:MAG TPA: putative Ig domain-containing protein [Verrucomicrobiae bacterium]
MKIMRNSSTRASHEQISAAVPFRSLRALWLRSGSILVFLLFALACELGSAQTLTSGSLYKGTIAANATNTYTFAATSGQSVLLRAGALTSQGYFYPLLQVLGPNGVVVGSKDPGSSSAAEVALTTTNSGTFTVLVSDGTYGGTTGTGTYELSYVEAPGAIVVSPGEQGGPLTNGTVNPGTIGVGELDSWTFTATNGDTVLLRAGVPTPSGYFYPWIRVYGPDGALVGSTDPGSVAAAEVALTATNTGSFIVVVSDGSYGGLDGVGTYQLSYVQIPGTFVDSPGEQGSLLTNGTVNPGTITVGALETWTFTATKKDSVVLRAGVLAPSGYFYPWIRVYGPDGVQVGSTDPGSVSAAEVALTATNTGTFTVVVADGTYGGIDGTGNYQLSYVKTPGQIVISPNQQGGPLTDGTENIGTISVGAMDAWTFAATNGDNIVLQAGVLTPSGYFYPWIRVYGPDGVLVGSQDPGSSSAAEVTLMATNTGMFTVVVADGTYGGIDGIGTYQLSFDKIPGNIVTSAGDQGGPLTNGILNIGTITNGDVDAWTFDATNGDSVILRAGDVTPSGYFYPLLRLYGPTGVLISSADPGSTSAIEIAVTATNTGTFTLLVSDGTYGGIDGIGTYALSLAHAPGPAFVSPGDEGGIMTNGVTYVGTNIQGDLDVWTFYGTVGDSNVFRMGSANFTPWLRLYGPDGGLVGQAFTANTGNRTNFLSYVVTNSGEYTLVTSAYYVTQFGTYNLKQSRVPPDLIVPGTQVINEGDTLNVTLTAQDPDVPIQPLTFAAVQLPPGANFSQSGGTNASITWATTEASGPSTNLIVATVTDVVNGKAFTRTNSFTVIVNEVNTPPHLTVPAAQVINELTPLNVTATATDADLPTNTLTFSLLNPPSGMNIDPTSGAISWTPTEAQGPSVATVTVVVTDYNPWAINSQHLSDTNSFTVTVNEVNTAPQITVPGNQTINELTTLSVSASATDSDIPVNPLTFSLFNPPQGMTIDPATGAISWTPTEAQGPSTNTITVVVTDSSPQAVNAQHLSASNSFIVTVNEVNTAPALTVPANQAIDELTTLNVTATATDSDLPPNPLTFTLLNPPQGMTISASTGAISWTPTEAQGPSTNIITVVVTDSSPSAVNAKNLSVTNTFTVTVNEVNTPPVLTVPTNQVIDELTTLNVTASATDSDIPVNPLTFSLVSPPQGMTINPSTGAISWTPTEAQGPSTNLITVVVTDSNPQAVNAQQLSVTNSFTVTVNEVNSAPVLAAIPGQSAHLGILFTYQAAATDSDIPTNTLTFSLDTAPSNMTINASSGLISWTPAASQTASYPVTVRVTDNGVPPLSDSQSFQITVAGHAPTLSIAPFAGGLMQITVTGDTGFSYLIQGSTDLENWTELLQFNLSVSPYQYLDPGSVTNSHRFYRLQLSQ